MKNERVVIILSEFSHIHWKWEKKNIYTNCLYYNEAVKNEKKKITINITIMKRINKKKRASGQNTSRNHPYSLEMLKQPFHLNI